MIISLTIYIMYKYVEALNVCYGSSRAEEEVV